MPVTFAALPSETAAQLTAQATISPADIAAAQALVAAIKSDAEILRDGRVRKIAADVLKPLWTLNGYRWDAETLQFIAANGRAVARDVVKAASELVTREAEYRLLNDALKLTQGEISTAEWYQLGKAHIKHGHTAQSALASGGYPNMGESTLSRAQKVVGFHYEKWRGFGGDVMAGRYGPEIEAKSFLQRANMYANAMRATAENERKDTAKDNGHIEARRVLAAVQHCDSCAAVAAMGWIPIDEMPEIGSDSCASNCHCLIITRRSAASFITDDLMDAQALAAIQD
jgi:hypothetical protein